MYLRGPTSDFVLLAASAPELTLDIPKSLFLSENFLLMNIRDLWYRFIISELILVSNNKNLCYQDISACQISMNDSFTMEMQLIELTNLFEIVVPFHKQFL